MVEQPERMLGGAVEMKKLVFVAVLLTWCAVATAETAELAISQPARGAKDVKLGIGVIALRTAQDSETREKPPETKPVTRPEKEPAGKPSVLGTWLSQNAERERRVEFKADGHYTYSIRSPEETSTTNGTYRVVPGKLELRPEGENEVLRVDFRFIDKNTFAVEEDEKTYEFKRQESPPGLADCFTGLPARAGKSPIVYDQLAPDRARLRRSSSGHILYVRFEMIKVQAAGVDETLPVPKIFVMTGQGEGQSPFISTKDPTQLFNPWWSPDGKSVVFASDFQSARSALFMDSFLADLESRKVYRITGSEWPKETSGGTGDIYGGVQGYFAQRISIPQQARVSYQGGGGRIYGLETEHVYSIETVPAGRIWVKCVISKHIGDIKLVDVVAGGHTRVEPMELTLGNFLATNPSISPDGRYLVILLQHASYDPFAELKERGVDTIAVCDVEKGGQCVAIWDPARTYDQLAKDPRLSPDGKWIALSMGQTGAESLAVSSLQSLLNNSPQPKVVLPGEEILASHMTGHRNPAWSPDGRRIAVVRAVSTSQGLTGNLFVVNADGSGLRQVTHVATNQCAANPTWSPDGKRIAFQLITSRRRVLQLTDLVMQNIVSDIWTVASDGSGLTQLTRDGRSAEPAWGP